MSVSTVRLSSDTFLVPSGSQEALTSHSNCGRLFKRQDSKTKFYAQTVKREHYSLLGVLFVSLVSGFFCFVLVFGVFPSEPV